MNNRVEQDATTHFVDVKGVSKKFVSKQGNVQPLQSVDMYINRGEIVGLSGNSGEGKSTLVNIMCGVVAPDSGNVYIDGQPLWNKTKYNRQVGRIIQPVFQQPFGTFDPLRTVQFAIDEAAQAGGVVNKAMRAALVADIASQLGITQLLLRKAGSLSGGQAQRCAIARALAVRPQLIIADESTAMLDVVCQAEVIILLRRLSHEQGISLLIISHNNELLRAVAQRSYALRDGKLTLL